MTGLGTRHTWPMLPAVPSNRAMANPCLACPQTRHKTSHSASESEGSGDTGTVQGYDAAAGTVPADPPLQCTCAGCPAQGCGGARRRQGDPRRQVVVTSLRPASSLIVTS